ncbi:MAG TPA: 23S rRNA (adenine(2503)-C(2))-methyltransferase RlmN, partial [Clostridia bacterium]|nr:23S rRNA (adenine(2503)-C(2))-methyltransferase RlmN [Clostridia bacterium]
MKQNLLGKFPEEIEGLLKELGQPSFRAKQVFEWLHMGVGFPGMTNIPKDVRKQLDECYIGNPVTIQKKLISTDGTIKYLFLLPDSNIIEGVLMKYRHGNTVCV